MGGNSTCVKCGDNQTPNGSKSACIPCKVCAVGQGFKSSCTAAEDTDCIDCNTTNPNAVSVGGKSRCEVCEPNHKATKEKAACIPCPVGEYRDADMSDCKACDVTQVSSGDGTSCQECKLGEERPNSAQSACVSCGTCEVGHGLLEPCVSGGNDTQCSRCEPGHFSVGGLNECKACPQKHFSTTDGSACQSCTPCPVGWGVNLTCTISSDTVCEKCAGKLQFSTGGDSSCEKCGAHTEPTDGRAACVPCLAGFYRNADMDVCEICPKGSYCNSTSIQECKEGQYCDEGVSRPSECLPGYYCPSPRFQIECTSGEHYCPRSSTQFQHCPAGALCTVPALPELLIGL